MYKRYIARLFVMVLALIPVGGYTSHLWAQADEIPVVVLSGHTSSVRGATELSDGRVLSWSYDATLRLWGDGE